MEKRTKCPNCGANITYDNEENKYVCKYCGFEEVVHFEERAYDMMKKVSKDLSTALGEGISFMKKKFSSKKENEEDEK